MINFITPIDVVRTTIFLCLFGERLQILIYARHSWALSSNCDTMQLFIMVIPGDQ